jgi:hypothetical protein
VILFDGAGNQIATIPVTDPVYLLSANVFGDSREELILVAKSHVEIYTNTAAFQPKKLYNTTYYPGE